MIILFISKGNELVLILIIFDLLWSWSLVIVFWSKLRLFLWNFLVNWIKLSLFFFMIRDIVGVWIIVWNCNWTLLWKILIWLTELRYCLNIITFFLRRNLFVIASRLWVLNSLFWKLCYLRMILELWILYLREEIFCESFLVTRGNIRAFSSDTMFLIVDNTLCSYIHHRIVWLREHFTQLKVYFLIYSHFFDLFCLLYISDSNILFRDTFYALTWFSC